jgi:hypothetical protein
MLRVKKGYENTTLTFRVGQNEFTLRVDDITEEHISTFRHHIDLNMYVERYEPIKEYIPELHDAETVMQSLLDEPKKKRTRKKK